MDMNDVDVYDNGSIFSFAPLTQIARDWVAENLPLESWQWLGNMFSVDARFADDIVQGMENDGLKVKMT